MSDDEWQEGHPERIATYAAQSGIPTPGCDCGHDGMGASWHSSGCTWITARETT